MISVVGGSGFIGTSLCQSLAARQQDFSILDVTPSAIFPDRSVQVDICDIHQLRDAIKGGVIIHLAAEHREDVRPPARYDAVNVGGTRNLVQVARETGVSRIIFASSTAVYGFAPAGTAEDGAIAPCTEYGRTKHAAEQVLRGWQREDPQSRALVIVRPTVVFGPGNRGNVFNLLSAINSGRFVMIGAGTNLKSMAFVDNLAAFLHHVLQLGPGAHLFNYVDPPDLTMNALVAHARFMLQGRHGVGLRLPLWLGVSLGGLADLASSLSGRTLPISAIRVRKFAASTQFSSAAHQLAGFSAPVPLLEGLARTIHHEFLTPDAKAGNARTPVFFTQ